MVIEQACHYLRNDDVSSLRYQKFVHHQEDVYPTFSLCIASYRGGLFKDSLGVHRAEVYFNYLQGMLKDVGLNHEYNITEINFEEAVLDIKKIFKLYHLKSKTMGGKLKTKRTMSFDEVFKVSYQDHEKICFSKQEIVEEKILLKVDMVLLSADWLASHDSQLSIYIHLKGQFLRSLGKPSAILIGKDLFQEKSQTNLGFITSIKANINSMDILRKRYNADETCNSTLENDDMKWLKALAEKLQCYPPFFGYIADTLDVQNKFPKCGKEGLYKIAHNFSTDNNFDEIANLYQPPCTQMSSVVTTNEKQKRSTSDRSVAVSFEYPTEYRETVNQREYSAYDLWSQIGGITGIIIGYSLMQIPESVGKALVWWQEAHSKRYDVQKNY